MLPAVNRRLVTLAAVASLLLCVAAVVLMVRSYWREDIVEFERASESEQLRKVETMVDPGRVATHV